MGDRKLPRTIWILWLQGWDAAPEVVRTCRHTWATHNLDWELRCLDHRDVGELLSGSKYERLLHLDLHHEALSDIVRIELLKRHGGVWVDATTYCLTPLSNWIDDVCPQGFFAFDRPGPDRMISSWFLASLQGSHIVTQWSEAVERYWEDRSARHHYFWFHYLFEEIYQRDAHVREAWDSTPKISAAGPHHFLPHSKMLRAPLTAASQTYVETPATPLLKLTHKLQPTPTDEGSAFRWLMNHAYADARQ